MDWTLAANVSSALGGIGTFFGVCIAPEVWRRQQQRQAKAQAAIECRFHAELLLTMLGERACFGVSEHDYDNLAPWEARWTRAGKLSEESLQTLRALSPDVERARHAYIRGLLYLRSHPDLAVFKEIISLQREALPWAADLQCYIAFMERRMEISRVHGAVFALEPKLHAAVTDLSRRSGDLFGEAARYELGVEKFSRERNEL